LAPEKVKSWVVCYSGPSGTENTGICKAGVSMCNSLGTAYGPCLGEVTPVAEACGTPEDDDCDGMINEEGVDCVCAPGSAAPCYSGPAGTADVGACKSGVSMCNSLGTAYGPCAGEVLPAAETCLTAADDDCDGMANESGAGCVCAPNSTASCYTGPAGTQNVGVCKAGTKTCNALGTAYGACAGQVLPGQETCMTSGDEDCDGQSNEGCAGLTCGLYTENFDDGNASPVTAGVYKLDWCDTNVPIAANTPLCMSGQTLRTNDSAIDPTMWIYKGAASCSQVKLTYLYYQFALAGVSVQYQQSNDANEVCEKSGGFISAGTHPTTQQCVQQTINIPFGNSSGVYIRFEHGAGSNAIWFDNITVELLGCDC
jgi:hypothetical protein